MSQCCPDVQLPLEARHVAGSAVESESDDVQFVQVGVSIVFSFSLHAEHPRGHASCAYSAKLNDSREDLP